MKHEFELLKAQRKHQVSFTNPHEILSFPWGMWIGFAVAILSFFWIVAGILYFAGSADGLFLMLFLTFSTVVCLMFIVMGIIGMVKRRRIREQLNRGMSMEQIFSDSSQNHLNP